LIIRRVAGCARGALLLHLLTAEIDAVDGSSTGADIALESVAA